MADQAWRDRCARAMGWVPNKSKNPIQDARYWADSDGDWVEPMSSWAPDESYDQAMMMRDEAAKIDHGITYIENLCGGVAQGLREAMLAYPNPQQIADAALKVLEGDDDA